MDLFASSPTAEDKGALAREELREALARLEPDRMTPINALTTLARLVTRAQKILPAEATPASAEESGSPEGEEPQ